MKQLLELITQWNRNEYWGEVTLVFKHGKLTIIKEQKQHKLSE